MTTTSTALVRERDAREALPPPVLTLAAGRQHTGESILRVWLEAKSECTRRSYRHDCEDFALFLSRSLGISPRLTVEEALTKLFRQSSPSAHEIVLAFRDHVQDVGMSSATINRHLACLRSVSKLARMLGAVDGGWYLEVPSVRSERRRQTAGPTVEDVRRMLAATAGDSEVEKRDFAIVVAFFCLGLRVSELCGLTLEDTDLARGTTWITGKGRRERELVPLPGVVVDAIRRYLRHRGDGWTGDAARTTRRGPVFVSSGHRGRARDGRLDTRSVLRIVRRLGQTVGLTVWCHALRHSAITVAIEKGQQAGVGLDQIRLFSRHRQLATMLVYRDEHDKAVTQRTLADVVAATITG